MSYQTYDKCYLIYFGYGSTIKEKNKGDIKMLEFTYEDLFDVPPTEEIITDWEKINYENDVAWWIEQFSEQNDYYGEDWRDYYPEYVF